MTERIAIVGAGRVGSNLAMRLAEAGYTVEVGVRETAAIETARARTEGLATAALVPDAVSRADVVFLAVPGAVAVEAARGLALAGKILVDCNNPFRWEGGPVWSPPPEGSIAAAIAAAVPAARVVKGFNTFGAEIHRDPDLGGTRADVLLAGDDEEAKQAVTRIAERMGFTPVDAGPLRNASVLENVAALWVHLAMVAGHGREFAFVMTRR